MNIALQENRWDWYELVFNGTKTFELSGETVVTDKMPDIGLLGETGAQVLLRAKRTETGQAVLEGELCVGVGYIPDGASGFCKTELTIPWQVSFEEESITEDAVSRGTLQIVSLETRVLNPRKLLVKAKLAAQLQCYVKKSANVCCGAKEETRLQLRKETMPCSVIATVCEKSFVVTDEYPLPETVHGGEVLHRTVQFRVDDVKTLSNKLILKGCVFTDAVVMSESGAVEKISFTSGFSMIAETDCEAVSPDMVAEIIPSALYTELSADGKSLLLELHGVCQMTDYRRIELSYVSDVYSNFDAITPEFTAYRVFENKNTEQRRYTESFAMPCHGQNPKILFSTAQICAEPGGPTEQRVGVKLSCCVRYDSGVIDWLKKQVYVSFPLKADERLTGVRIADVYCGVGVGEAELRVTLEGDVREQRENILRAVSAVKIEAHNESQPMGPSLTVLRTGGNVWDLAKKYGSTPALICKYNDITEDELPEEMLLLIPRQYV